ncbi:E3 ubiquitin-protein ligase Praja-1 [Sorex araneus]|uniref:E3 ubiquitin-protein ligase Praja-1 n=1 Tax=Sorex araneus TaxID=42254 RepID=UPI0003317787|nr:E3 ubiquitin-protein ligase Praja-1 [Sorex araneus]XP_054976777.1 E3 ubiquitin-protein ligase Praja-1 [Sorex araneus]
MSQRDRISSQRQTTTKAPMYRSTPSQTNKRSRSPFSTTRRRWDGNTNSGSSLNVDDEDCSRYQPREYRASGSRRGLTYGHVDCLGADDSEEEGAGPVEHVLVRGKTGKFKEENVYDQDQGVRSVPGVATQFSGFNHDVREELGKLDPDPGARCSTSRAEFLQQNRMGSQAHIESKMATSSHVERERWVQNVPICPSRAPVSICGDGENPQQSSEEPVVRPKVRNLASPTCIKPKVFFDTDDDDDVPHSTSRWNNTDEGRSDGLARRSREESATNYSELKYPEDKKDGKNEQVKPEKVQRQRRSMADPDFWTHSDDYYRFFEDDDDDDDDSDSDREWIEALRQKYRVHGHTLSSSGGSWETLPGREEPEPDQARVNTSTGDTPSTTDASGSNVSNELTEVQIPLQDEQQTSQEGEIPWLQFNAHESSSEGENDSGQDLLQSGVFMLDGNNNLEDDSSVSEDLEVDWSLFDGFADGLGVAEAISYVDPQFLTYMALEERLAQAMETALAHLESLAVDVEVANPPASKESIDTLPEILIAEDQTTVGEEMCCPICCSEYVKGEVATELPCHHYFHKACVSIWLQKSGTCPVCRCMFPPQL